MPLQPDQVLKINRKVKDILNMAGQNIVLRKFIARQAGRPELGIQDQPTYRELNTVAILDTPNLDEVQERGGQYFSGRIVCKMQEHIGEQDEIIWQGNVYRVDSEPVPISIGTTQYWKCFLIHGGHSS